MTWIMMFVVLICGAIMQTLTPVAELFGQAKFPFLLGITLYYALACEGQHMIVAAFVAGFLQDALSPIPLGYSSFCYCVIGLAASRFRHVIVTDSPLPAIFFGGLAAPVMTLALYVLLIRENLIECGFWWLVLKMAGSLVMGAICVPIIFYVLGRLDRMVGNVAAKEETAVIDIE